MSEPFIAQIMMFGGNFAPRGWAFCSGQILSIAQNTALFSLLGTTYGGNGQTTFALPDLRGRVPIHPGTGPGLSPYDLGQVGGTEATTLLIANMPPHNHTATGAINANSGAANDSIPTGNYLAESAIYHSGTNTAMAANSVAVNVGISGGGQPFNNIQPYTCVNFIIALEGIFPSRN
jgi:microcystin-dependent protein